MLREIRKGSRVDQVFFFSNSRTGATISKGTISIERAGFVHNCENDKYIMGIKCVNLKLTYITNNFMY